MLRGQETKIKTEKEGLPTYRYAAVRQVRRLEDVGRYVTYGLFAYRKQSGVWRVVAGISDVSTERQAVRRLARVCTEGNLDPVHLFDVVEDFLGS